MTWTFKDSHKIFFKWNFWNKVNCYNSEDKEMFQELLKMLSDGEGTQAPGSRWVSTSHRLHSPVVLDFLD